MAGTPNSDDPPAGRLANLSLQEENHITEAASPNGMLVDQPEAHIVEPNGTESEDVAVINPDGMDVDTPVATDRTFRFPPPPACRC